MINDQVAKLGLGNSIGEETDILHTSILGKRSFGRIADLLLAWTEKHYKIPFSEASNLRMISQALMEFAYPEGKSDLGYMEFAVENEKRFISVRFPWKLRSSLENFEKDITHYWMNESKAMMVKKNLGAHDRVEVRYHEKLELIEWRVINRIGVQEIELKESSFMVYVDGGEKVSSFHKKYTDLGDLPFDKLLTEVYKTSQSNKQSNAELFFQGQSLQNEEEAVRITFEKEQQEIEDEIRISSNVSEEVVERIIQSEAISEQDDSEITIKASKFADETVTKIRVDQTDVLEHAKLMVKDAKAKELQAQRRMIAFHQKITKLEELLRRKETVVVRGQNQVKLLSEKLTDLQSKASDAGNAKKFREKALQMHSMLVKVKEDNANLEKMIQNMKNKEKDHEASQDADQILSRSSSVVNIQLEEVSKKADRLQRALEAEKIKVKQLSERVMSAEKESQAAGPIIEDLERKVEQSLRLTQHHKKETESIKQKLVQAETEKNKLLNELAKSKAEIQTLLKRQAG